MAVCVCRGDSVGVSRGPDTPAQHARGEDVCLHLFAVLVVEQIGGNEYWGSSAFCLRFGGVLRGAFQGSWCLSMCVCREPGW